MEQQLILDRYRPLEELGEGAFGSVVLAWDTRMQRKVAIKRLPLPSRLGSGPGTPAGLAEARTAAMLNHPNIVTVFDFDTDSDEAFLVMEYVEGASVAEMLEDLGEPPSLDEAASIVSDVASALQWAHENGVLHLDIKPENVLLARDGRALVADFGIAELSSLSGHGPAFGGTLGYMPPEQLEGASVDERTDEWALAALAFELVSGDNPFAAHSLDDPDRLRAFEPPSPSSYEAALPPALDDILLAALGPDPEDRYPCVADFAEQLLAVLGDPNVGRSLLSELVEQYWEDDEDRHPSFAEIGLWDRLGPRLGPATVRGVAAVEAGWLTWVGLGPFELDPLAQGGAIGLAALAAVFAPGLGIGLGLGCFVAGLIAAKAWLVSALVLVLGGAWWWWIGRRDHAAAVLPLAAPVLALGRMSFAQPLLAGFSLPPGRAALTGLAGGVLTMLASAASAQSEPYLAVWPGYALDVWNTNLSAFNITTLVTSPAALMALLGWPAAAALMSYICARATRPAAVLGAVGGSVALAVAYVAADRISQSSGNIGGYEGATLAVTVGASLILVIVVALLGPPMRGEEENVHVPDMKAEDY